MTIQGKLPRLGYVAEGVTTYKGDLMLKEVVYSMQQFQKHKMKTKIIGKRWQTQYVCC